MRDRPYTRQEAFDIASVALIKQGKPSWNGMSCLYRSPDALKCAIGHLIPDDDYKEDIESTSAFKMVETGRFPHLFNPEDGEFYDKLQDVHDDFEPALWPDEFRALAKEYGLSHAVIPEAPA